MKQRLYLEEVADVALGSFFTLYGWVAALRDHGGIVFIELRDRTATLQCVFDPAHLPDLQHIALKPECVLKLQGQIVARPEGTEKQERCNGDREFHVESFELLSQSEALPIPMGHPDVAEELRLKYRYLDLRSADNAMPFILRSKVLGFVRNYLEKHHFIECETPILTKPTPEGARDYLVPSRLNHDASYALPQSPQLFKQLLMASGFDRYYQVARCFRDEDLRADRQPEFTQLDIEMTFINEHQIQELIEEMVKNIFNQVLGVQLPNFERMTYTQAMERYGSDKPDLRCPLVFETVSDLFVDSDFQVFREPARTAGQTVVAMRVPLAAQKLSRSDIDKYTAYVRSLGAAGLAYIKVEGPDMAYQGPVAKFFSAGTIKALNERLHVAPDDIIFFAAGPIALIAKTFAPLRERLRDDLQLIERPWAPLWVTDFPMFEWDDKTQRYYAMHHPFTAPTIVDPNKPESWLSRGYDFVLNGFEIGGGSIRIHTMEMQSQVFDILGITKEEAQEKFGFLLEAMRYGFPPHGGIALGIDRLIMLMAKKKSLRDVILFPKTQSGVCPLTGAPGAVTAEQLKDLGLKRIKIPVAQTPQK
jgi:aspartyl-tRNA synthetase